MKYYHLLLSSPPSIIAIGMDPTIVSSNATNHTKHLVRTLLLSSGLGGCEHPRTPRTESVFSKAFGPRRNQHIRKDLGLIIESNKTMIMDHNWPSSVLHVLRLLFGDRVFLLFSAERKIAQTGISINLAKENIRSIFTWPFPEYTRNLKFWGQTVGASLLEYYFYLHVFSTALGRSSQSPKMDSVSLDSLTSGKQSPTLDDQWFGEDS